MPESPLIKANCIPRLPSSLKLKDFDGSVFFVSTVSWLGLNDSVCMVILDLSVWFWVTLESNQSRSKSCLIFIKIIVWFLLES